MSYRGRNQRPFSRPVNPRRGSRTSEASDRDSSSLNELARLLESTRLAASYTQRIGQRSSQYGLTNAPEIPHVNARQPGRSRRAGDVDEYVQQIIAAITPSESDLLLKRTECSRIEDIVRRVLPNARLRIMGGTANSFALKDSDVDVCIVGADHGIRRLDTTEVNRLSNALRERGYVIETLQHTFVPLIRVFVRPNGTSASIQMELSWTNPIGIYKTELLAAYSGIDDRVKRLVQFVKYWAKTRKLSDTRHGGMGSFAWSLTCIYFLISVAQPPVLPNLQNTTSAPQYFEGFNVAFSRNIAGSYHSSNQKTLGSIITDFFEFVDSFDFHRYVISIKRSDALITKAEKGWTANLVRGYGSSGQRVFHSYFIAIEDPFETGNNAARTVSHTGFSNIKSEITRAARMLKGSSPDSWEELSQLCEPKFSFY